MMLELAIYSCITTHTMMDDSFTKSCRWNSRGFYASEIRCREDGKVEAPRKVVHEFSVVIGSPRIAESYRCSPVPLLD